MLRCSNSQNQPTDGTQLELGGLSKEQFRQAVYQNISTRNYYLPVPEEQIVLNPNLEQNWGYADYNKRELLWQVLDQSRPNDYIPVFFNIHFKDKEGQKAVQSHIDWFKTTHVDFVNVKYEYFPTIFSPLRVLIQTAGSQLSSDREGRRHFVELIKKDPKAIKPALEAVTSSLVYYIREARKAGADGFYISSQGDDLEEFGDGVFASVINPPLHNWKDKAISLKDISKLFGRPVLGGLNNRSKALYEGTLEELKLFINKKVRTFRKSLYLCIRI